MALGRWHKRILCAFHCTEHSDEPLKTKSCSALASTIFESPLHRTKVTCTIFFCAICQAALPDRTFDTRILSGKKQPCRTIAVPSTWKPCRPASHFRRTDQKQWQNSSPHLQCSCLPPMKPLPAPQNTSRPSKAPTKISGFPPFSPQ